MYILSQVFVVISGILFTSTYLFKKKGIILVLNVFNNMFFGTHFLLLKSFTAAYSVFLTLFFLIVVYLLEKFNKEKYLYAVLIVSILLLLVITIFTWDGLLSLMPWFAILLVLVGTILKNTLVVKLFYYISTIINTIFMFIIKSYFGFSVNIGILIIACVGIILHIRKQKSLA